MRSVSRACGYSGGCRRRRIRTRQFRLLEENVTCVFHYTNRPRRLCHYNITSYMTVSRGVINIFLQFLFISPPILLYRLRVNKISVRNIFVLFRSAYDIPHVFDTIMAHLAFKTNRYEFVLATGINRYLRCSSFF